MYCPPGFIDGEDGSGNVINSTWRKEQSPGGLRPVGPVGGNRYIQLLNLFMTIVASFGSYYNTHVGVPDLLPKFEIALQATSVAMLAKSAGNIDTFSAHLDLL